MTFTLAQDVDPIYTFDSNRFYISYNFIPTELELDLTKYLSESSDIPLKYKLVSSVFHKDFSVGNKVNGHYTAIVKNRNKFYKYDDANQPEQQSNYHVETDQPYFLFYIRELPQQSKWFRDNVNVTEQPYQFIPIINNDVVHKPLTVLNNVPYNKPITSKLLEIVNSTADNMYTNKASNS